MRIFSNSIGFVGFVFLVAIAFATKANSFPKSIQKKIDKELNRVFPIDNLTMGKIDNFNYDPFKYQEIKNVSLRKLTSATKLLGYACFASSEGKNEYFDYMVLFSDKMKIKKVVVLMYRSSYGGEIMSKSWLKQFIGKVKGEEMEFGKDIDGISGATISAPSITKGIKAVSLLMNDWKEQGGF